MRIYIDVHISTFKCLCPSRLFLLPEEIISYMMDKAILMCFKLMFVKLMFRVCHGGIS